jgi:hypothetical protein
MTDYSVGRGSYAPLSTFQKLNNTNITRIGLMWVQFYLSIRNANLVIANAPKATNLNKTEVAAYVAEAKFMRAICYFHMVRNWGGLILRTEENIIEKDVPRSSVEDVYALIEKDLVYAEQNLKDQPRLIGAPSKWAAKTVLADVYFYEGKYSEASNKAEEVVESGKYSLVEVSKWDDFDKIFGATIVNTPEEIFYFKYSTNGDKQYSSSFNWTAHHPKDPYFNGAGSYIDYCNTENYVYKNWDDADLRKQQWYPWVFGLGNNTLLNRKFVDVVRANGEGANDHPMYRYADVLLLYAEASCRANNGPTQKGLEALNKIHRRGYGKNSNQVSNVDFKISDYNAGSFIDLVIKERGYETMYESKRYLDLKRLGTKGFEIIKTATGLTASAENLLWPIPVSEMNYNKALDPTKDQNPGY